MTGGIIDIIIFVGGNVALCAVTWGLAKVLSVFTDRIHK